MAKKTANDAPQFQSFTLDMLGSAPLDKINATWEEEYFQIALNNDRNKYQLYLYIVLRDDDTGEIIERPARYFADHLVNRDGEVQWVTSNDGKTIAGPDGVDLTDFKELGTGTMLSELGDGNYKEEEFRGTYAITPIINGRPVAVSMRSSFIQHLRDQLKKVLEAENVPWPGDDLENFRGYSFFWSREEQERFGSRKPAKEGEQQLEFKTLVPMTLNSAPKAGSGGGAKKSAGGAKGAATTTTAATKSNSGTKDTSDDTADLDTEIEEETTALLSESDSPLDKKGWQAPLVKRLQEKHAGDVKRKQAIVQRVLKAGNTGWFLDDSRPWTVDEDGGTISL